MSDTTDQQKHEGARDLTANPFVTFKAPDVPNHGDEPMLSAPPAPNEGHENPQVSAIFALDPRDAADAVLTDEQRDEISNCLGCNDSGLTLALDGQPVRCLHVTKPTAPIPTRTRKRRSKR